jgi:hypothetical protein
MIYDLYFHDDFDGRAAGAVMLAFLRSRGDDIGHFQPLGYYLLADYLKENFFTAHRLFKGKRNPAIVVDFPFHPKAAWWFDHHGGPFRKKGWKEKFKPSAFLHHDPEYASCCGQVAAVLKKEFGWKLPARLENMVHWGDIIDGAKYRSARQTIELKEPALQIDAFFDRHDRSPAVNKRFVTLLAEKSLPAIAKRPEVRQTVHRAKREITLATAYVKKNITVAGRVARLYFSQPEFSKPRFLPYYLYPWLLYLVRFFEVDGQYKLSIGQNPWRAKEGTVNLGQLISRYAGGGGHFGVGAAEFKTRGAVEKAAQEMVDYFIKRTNGKR